MFHENLKKLRKTKGLTQEEIAERLHVTRQTISKWERGLSVPDSDLLIRLAEVFEVSVSALLGSEIELTESEEKNVNIIAQKLEQLNVLLAERNKRSRTIWKVVSGILIGIVVIIVVYLLIAILGIILYTPVGDNSGEQQVNEVVTEYPVMIEE